MAREVEVYEADSKLPKGVRARVTKALSRLRRQGTSSYLRYVLCSNYEWLNKQTFQSLDHKLQLYRTDYRQLGVMIVHLDLEEDEKLKLGYTAISLVVSRY